MRDKAGQLTSGNEDERVGDDVRMIEFGVDDGLNLSAVVDLHMELLDYGPLTTSDIVWSDNAAGVICGKCGTKLYIVRGVAFMSPCATRGRFG